MKSDKELKSGCWITIMIVHINRLVIELQLIYLKQSTEDMTSFSIDKQRGQVNAEWMSRPVDSFKNQTKNQPLALVLISIAQSPTFAYRLKRKLLSGPIFGEAYITPILKRWSKVNFDSHNKKALYQNFFSKVDDDCVE